MQFEVAHPSCPLCKRQVPANSPEQTLSTRLCEQCQAMVLTAFRRPDSIAAAPTAVVPQNGSPGYVQHDAPVLDQRMVAAPALFEGYGSYAPAFEHELQSPIPFDMPDAGTFDFYKDEDPDYRTPTADADSFAFSENGTSRHREELSEEFVKSISATGHESAEADESRLAAQPSEFTVDSADRGPHLVEDRSEDPAVIGEEAATDPWEAPLPAWDYSHSEWPVLVGPTKRSSSRKLRYGIAAVVLLACATGFYFLIYRPSTIPQPRTATDSGTTAQVPAVEPGPLAVGSADSNHAQAAPKPSDARAGAASQQAETASREAVASNDNSAKGRFSLQAAAFPTEGGADELAEKLKRSGLPSYVVPADLARRGRWFRVRVGRFNSAEDAQRFAGEAQQRARATGLSVQLIVCQYDQP